MQQQTAESTAVLNLLTWIEVNKRKLLIGVALGAAVILAVVIVVKYQAQKEVRASEALSEIKVPFNPATPLPPETLAALQQVAQEHQGTKAAARALLLAGAYFYADKKYPQAQEQFARLVDQYSESEWMPEALLGLATSLDAQSKTNEAIAEYEKLRKRFANHAVTEEAKLAVARLYEGQKPEDAYKLYDELSKASPMGQMSGLAAEAGLRKVELKEKHPELAKLDAPILPPAPTPGAPNITTNRPPLMITNRPAGVTNLPRQITITNRASAGTSQVIRIPSPPLEVQPP